MKTWIKILREKFSPWEKALHWFRGCQKQAQGLEPELLAMLFSLVLRYGQDVGGELIFRDDNREVILRPLTQEAFDMIVRYQGTMATYLGIELPEGSLVHWDRDLAFDEMLFWAMSHPPTATTYPCPCDHK